MGIRDPLMSSHFDEIEKICSYLEREFKGAAFPLANNVDRPRQEIQEKAGLGMAIRTLPVSVYKGSSIVLLGTLP
jgi:hypothetical protein